MRKKFGERERGLGDEKIEESRERSIEMRCGSHEENIIYRPSVNLDR